MRGEVICETEETQPSLWATWYHRGYSTTMEEHLRVNTDVDLLAAATAVTDQLVCGVSGRFDAAGFCNQPGRQRLHGSQNQTLRTVFSLKDKVLKCSRFSRFLLQSGRTITALRPAGLQLLGQIL